MSSPTPADGVVAGVTGAVDGGGGGESWSIDEVGERIPSPSVELGVTWPLLLTEWVTVRGLLGEPGIEDAGDARFDIEAARDLLVRGTSEGS